jgi:predicted AAA+ superfamily ATPase
MAITNYERIGKAMELLRDGIRPYVEREMAAARGKNWLQEAIQTAQIPDGPPLKQELSDPAFLLKILWQGWNDVFRVKLGQSERTLVSELMEVRKKWAHMGTFSYDDTYRALDSIERLLTSVSAGQSDEVNRMKRDVMRVKFDEERRLEQRKSERAGLKMEADSALKPWREIVTPHKDVQSGRYLQAEFAADLWQVYLGEGSEEYRLPVEFFRRTYLTEGLRQLLVTALRRVSGKAADPVVELQTNFGGGKTHSMLALFHLFSGKAKTELPGLEEVFTEAEVDSIPKVRRAVLVGTKISPGQPLRKEDGTLVRTLWGEIAWQLGKREAYEMLRESDEKATNPGDVLRQIFNKYAPCLILIDEWVAYARQLYGQGNALPSGSFDTQASFCQALSEAARAAKDTILVVSIPASEAIPPSCSDPTEFSDSEIGGEGGRAALDMLEQKIGRIQSPWRPAAAEESFEIVRRRLFDEIHDQNLYRARDTVVRAFADMYRKDSGEFPPHASRSDYERRLTVAYPIHPDMFESLYNDWSSLERFQRTRGVLRLMASVIHNLWDSEDRSLLILPASIPINERTVESELLRYLPPTWAPVIEKDVDGGDSLATEMDRENPNFGRYSACRRVGRTLFIGSAPTHDTARRGREEKQILLGCVQPGENAGTFTTALRRMAERGQYLYSDGQRYWYSTQLSVNRRAEDLAKELLERRMHEVHKDIKDRVRKQLERRENRGDFARVHDFPDSSADVPDDMEARLVIMGPSHVHVRGAEDSEARRQAAEILRSRGASPRNYANALMFLAGDRTGMASLEKAVAQYLAWKDICAREDELNLDKYNREQAKKRRETAEETVDIRLPEAYSWLLAPTMPDPKDGKTEWRTTQLQGKDALAVRASKKVTGERLLLTQYAGSVLRLQMDDARAPLWQGDHVGVRQLAEYFAKYLYLPRLKDTKVLIEAVATGVATLNPQAEGFGYADGYDEARGRYLGLKISQNVSVDLSQGLVVKPEMAILQLDIEEEERRKREAERRGEDGGGGRDEGGGRDGKEEKKDEQKDEKKDPEPRPKPKPRRFHGSVTLDARRFVRNAGDLSQEVLQHLAGLAGAEVEVRIEIGAKIPDGAPDHVVRTVSENCRTLKFGSFGFEEE